MALRNVAVDPNADPNDFRRRIPIFAPGDPMIAVALRMARLPLLGRLHGAAQVRREEEG